MVSMNDSNHNNENNSHNNNFPLLLNTVSVLENEDLIREIVTYL